MLYYSFLASLGRRPKRISMVQFWFMKKVNEYYLFLNQGLSNSAVRKNQRSNNKSEIFRKIKLDLVACSFTRIKFCCHVTTYMHLTSFTYETSYVLIKLLVMYWSIHKAKPLTKQCKAKSAVPFAVEENGILNTV